MVGGLKQRDGTEQVSWTPCNARGGGKFVESTGDRAIVWALKEGDGDGGISE
jgi:hypothetical protein